MAYSIKLSIISTYRIRKILIANQTKLIVNQIFDTESQIDLEKTLVKIYLEKSKFEYQINQLETLSRMHQVLVNQQTVRGVHEIENEIFVIFGLKPNQSKI